MKLGNVSLLGVALATALAATACNRTDDTASTYNDKPATTADQPATEPRPRPPRRRQRTRRRRKPSPPRMLRPHDSRTCHRDRARNRTCYGA